MTGDQPILPKWRQRLLGWLEQPLPNRPQLRKLALLLAFVFFIGGIYWSLQRNPDLLADISIWHVLLVFTVGVPITVFLNALRIQLAALLLVQAMPFSRACEITILSMAANLLPLPGGIFIRIAAFKTADTGYRHSLHINMCLILLWVGVVLIYAGSALFFITASNWAALLAFSGIALSLGIVTVMFNQYGNPRFCLYLLVLQFVMTATDAVRLWFCLISISVATGFLQASFLTISAVAGSAVSIVPAGLGIRELAAALLSPLVGLTPEAGFMAASLNRIIGLSGIMLFTALLLFAKLIRSELK